VNLLQVCQAVIGVEGNGTVCTLHLSNGELLHFDGSGQLSVLARITELSVALNGEPLRPVNESLEDQDGTQIPG
jgi:hypothetical protein